MKFTHAGGLVDGLVDDQLEKFAEEKSRIKAATVAKQTRREKSRLIESADRRIVHFIFSPGQTPTMSPFTVKLTKLLEGFETLQEFEKDQAEKFDAYIAGITAEEPDLVDPIVREPSPFEELELKSLHRLAFAVADNPFMKTDIAKYYPEIHVVLADGTLAATISPSNKSDAIFGSSYYMDNFRDDHLKINDDRKVRLTLSDFKDRRDMMILLTVRMNDAKGAEKGAFDQAWYRLQNEDTNQTLDYSYVEKTKKDNQLEDGEEEEAEVQS